MTSVKSQDSSFLDYEAKVLDFKTFVPIWPKAGTELRQSVIILSLLFYLPHRLRNSDLFAAIKIHYPLTMPMNSPYQSEIS